MQTLSDTRLARNAQSSKTMPTFAQFTEKKSLQRPDSAFVTTSMLNFRWV